MAIITLGGDKKVYISSCHIVIELFIFLFVYFSEQCLEATTICGLVSSAGFGIHKIMRADFHRSRIPESI